MHLSIFSLISTLSFLNLPYPTQGCYTEIQDHVNIYHYEKYKENAYCSLMFKNTFGTFQWPGFVSSVNILPCETDDQQDESGKYRVLSTLISEACPVGALFRLSTLCKNPQGGRQRQPWKWESLDRNHGFGCSVTGTTEDHIPRLERRNRKDKHGWRRSKLWPCEQNYFYHQRIDI